MPESKLGLPGRLFILLQHLLPQQSLTRLVYGLTRIRFAPIKDATIRWFSWQFGVDTSEAERPVPDGYEHFNDFFTRRLKPGLRPMPRDPQVIVAPCDGVLSQSGRLDGQRILQVKGCTYEAAALLGGDKSVAARFTDGEFLTIYLAPYDYHRVHMPMDARLRRTTHLPGRLFSVNATTAAGVERLFVRNERLVALFQTEHGLAAMVLVGALNVGTIGVAWQSELRADNRFPTTRDWPRPEEAPLLKRGEEMGWFNMGSTVILLMEQGLGVLSTTLTKDTRLRTGQAIGRLSTP